MTYRLLALDIDGTLMGPDLVIADVVQQAIATAQARGVAVTLATGRMFGATLPFAKLLNIDTPVICYQGGMVRHPRSGETYSHALMPGEEAAEAARLLRAAGVFTLAYIDERLCIEERRAEFDMYMRYHPEGTEVVQVDDLAALVSEQPATKILFVADPPVVEREISALAAHFAGRLSCIRSHALFGEITPLGVSKGSALATLAQQLGIPREQVVAIGDHENDLPMIEWAGLGLAMGNAIPQVRERAAAVLPSVSEDGVAWAINTYILTD